LIQTQAFDTTFTGNNVADAQSFGFDFSKELVHTASDNNPLFDSENYKDFIFKEPMIPSNKSVLLDALKRDKLELRLYQVCPCAHQLHFRN
jgi:hypothetical protein